MAKAISINPDHPGALKEGLEASGWLDSSVVAAGHLRQGTEPSLTSMLTGTALFGLLKKQTKKLPRYFVLAVAGDRIVAYRAVGVGNGEPGDLGYEYKVRISPGEKGSFSRAGASVSDVEEEKGSLLGVLHLDGEDIPFHHPGDETDPDTSELISLLSS